MTDHLVAYRVRLPGMLIPTRPRRRRLRWSSLGFAALALMLVALAVLSILYVGPSPFAGPAAPALRPAPVDSLG